MNPSSHPSWLRKVARRLSRIAVRLDHLRLRIKRRLGWLGPPLILPYRGFGNHQELYLRGKVLEDNGLAKPAHRNSLWHNFVAMYKRYISSEIPNVRLQASFEGVTKEVTTNDTGYFEVKFHLSEALLTQQNWVEIDLELIDQVIAKQREVRVKGQVMISQDTQQFGVISDVDDTILISKATSFYKKIRLMLLKNARTRLPFEGVAAFYDALQKGIDGTYVNPIFYVSSSSWNLYDLLVDFCEVRGIPKGPFLLRDSRLDEFKFLSSIHTGHKLRKIHHILSTYDHTNFILIGDSGQKDAEIYRQVIEEFPGRILAVYIRDVSNAAHKEAVREIAKALRTTGVEMLLVADTEAAARHAAQQGYIDPRTLPEITREKKQDHTAPSDLEQMTSREKEPVSNPQSTVNSP